MDPSKVVVEASAALRVDVQASWIDAVHAVQSMTHVLTHGDVHGEQLMTTGNTLTGILDWETAAIDNPVRDFNFREWGRGWYRAHEVDFALVREALWSSYADARVSTSLPDWQTVHLFFSLMEAWESATSTHPFDIDRLSLTRSILVAATSR